MTSDCACLDCSLAAAVCAADVPYLSGRVVDDAEILSPAARERLTAALKQHEDRTTNQIVGAHRSRRSAATASRNTPTTCSANGSSGKKGKDNGVLVVVAPKDRKMRIEVGYGLEGTLTDAMSSRIIRNEMTPAVQEQQFRRRHRERRRRDRRAARVGDAARGRHSPRRPAATRDLHQQTSKSRSFRRGRCASCSARSSSASSGSSPIIGVMTPGMGWFLYLFLIPFWAMFPIIIVGIKGALDAPRRSTSSGSRSRSSSSAARRGTTRPRWISRARARRRSAASRCARPAAAGRAIRRRAARRADSPAAAGARAAEAARAAGSSVTRARRARTTRRRDRARTAPPPSSTSRKPALRASSTMSAGAYHVLRTDSLSSAMRSVPRRCT